MIRIIYILILLITLSSVEGAPSEFQPQETFTVSAVHTHDLSFLSEAGEIRSLKINTYDLINVNTNLMNTLPLLPPLEAFELDGLINYNSHFHYCLDGDLLSEVIVERLPNLKELRIVKDKILNADKLIASLNLLSNLEYLSLAKSNLTNLVLYGFEHRDMDFTGFSELTSLKCLDISSVTFQKYKSELPGFKPFVDDESFLEGVASIPNLEKLICLGGVMPYWAFERYTMPALTTLETDIGYAPIADFAPNLTHLVIPNSTIYTLDFLAPLTKLRYASFEGSSFTEESKLTLKWTEIPELEILNLSKTNCRQLPFDHFTNLKEVYLNKTNIGGGDVMLLAKIPTLEVVELNETKLTGSVISHLSKMISLRSLSLAGTSLSGAPFEKLAHLKTLKVLDLSHTKLDRDDLEQLAALKQLDRLILKNAGNVNVRPQDFESLIMALPSTEIVYLSE